MEPAWNLARAAAAAVPHELLHGRRPRGAVLAIHGRCHGGLGGLLGNGLHGRHPLGRLVAGQVPEGRPHRGSICANLPLVLEVHLHGFLRGLPLEREPPAAWKRLAAALCLLHCHLLHEQITSNGDEAAHRGKGLALDLRHLPALRRRGRPARALRRLVGLVRKKGRVIRISARRTLLGCRSTHQCSLFGSFDQLEECRVRHGSLPLHQPLRLGIQHLPLTPKLVRHPLVEKSLRARVAPGRCRRRCGHATTVTRRPSCCCCCSSGRNQVLGGCGDSGSSIGSVWR
mmetsp:Transcript_115975/g.291788  ORF Transcript_115975/g.291788 Transcript_115975/m.291788 type:complete len:286 (-) Transcript_115975:167-1024(-)